jgi:hypothetical protein
MSRMSECMVAMPSENTNIQKSRACTRKWVWLLRMRLPTPMRMRRWLGGSARNSGNTSRGSTSKALTAARNRGLKVSLDVEGNSLRSARSRLVPRPGATCRALADVYAIFNPGPYDVEIWASAILLAPGALRSRYWQRRLSRQSRLRVPRRMFRLARRHRVKAAVVASAA